MSRLDPGHIPSERAVRTCHLVAINISISSFCSASSLPDIINDLNTDSLTVNLGWLECRCDGNYLHGKPLRAMGNKDRVRFE